MSLVTRLGVALLLIGAMLPLADRASTFASFTDRVSDNGAGLTAGSLPAPTNVGATLVGGASVSAQVTWNSAAGDFATGWEIFRNAGGCSGWTPTGSPYATSATRAYTDSGLALGTYCYAVRGTYLTWTSPFVAITTAAQVTFVQTQLFPTDSGTKQLITSAGSGAEPFGCLLLNLVICVGGHAPDSYVLPSTATYLVTSSTGWTASLDLTSQVLVALGAQTLEVKVWYENGACGVTAPTDGRLIASANIVLGGLVTVLGNHSGVFTPSLTANPGFVAPNASRTICMSMTANPSLASALVTLTLNNGANTWIKGPFGP
jgi:hypothetical protein